MGFIFETERLLIRQFVPEDQAAFIKLNSDPEIVRYIRPPKDEAGCIHFFHENLAAYITQPLMGRWAMLYKESLEHVGSFAIIPKLHSTEVQLGYALFTEHWGKGYATESVKGGLKYAFQVMKLAQVWGLTRHENTISGKVLQKCGFTFHSSYTDKDGNLIDQFLIQNV